MVTKNKSTSWFNTINSFYLRFTDPFTSTYYFLLIQLNKYLIFIDPMESAKDILCKLAIKPYRFRKFSIWKHKSQNTEFKMQLQNGFNCVQRTIYRRISNLQGIIYNVCGLSFYHMSRYKQYNYVHTFVFVHLCTLYM